MYGVSRSFGGTDDVEGAAHAHHADGGAYADATCADATCADATVAYSAADERTKLGVHACPVALGAGTGRHPAPHGDRELHIGSLARP